MSSGLAASTVTPGSTAPDVSLTTPVMDDWARAAAGTSTSAASNAIPLSQQRIPSPPHSSSVDATLVARIREDPRGRALQLVDGFLPDASFQLAILGVGELA